MQKTALRSAKSGLSNGTPRNGANRTSARIGVTELERQAEGWLLDGEIQQHSKQTLATRCLFMSKLVWFLRHQDFQECGTLELRQFPVYLTRGHEETGGRWGNPHLNRPVRPRTVKDYHGHLRTFFRWLVSEGVLEVSPLEAIPAPTARPDQIQPFTEAQVGALLSAARRSQHPRRDEAVVMFLLDTGMRASELCTLKLRDLDLSGKKAVVLGKGNKHRAVYFGRSTAKALWQHLKEDPRDPESPVFFADRGPRAGEPLTRWGVRQIIERLGKAAGIEAVRCSPHTLRHTMAVSFLRNGGQVFALKELLGHTDLKMTNRYVALAQADIENQHRQFSPVDRIRKGS
jgi:site-specific recombinase XerD